MPVEGTKEEGPKAKIKIEKRSGEYFASVEGMVGFGNGNSSREAIGNLVTTSPEIFSVAI